MTIPVTYEVASTNYRIRKVLDELATMDRFSFDTETRGVYSKAEREEARAYLKEHGEIAEFSASARLVEGNSGLSFPSLINVTHFVFGTSVDFSYILIPETPRQEMRIWKFLAKYPGLVIIHNSLFDLKIMYHRVKKFPQNYVDTALYVKCLTNHVNVWKAKTGLKELMGSYYDPQWSLLEDYEPENLREPKFLNYAGIDGAATYHLWDLILEMKNE